MLTQIINGQILTPQGWLKDGSVLISDGKILEVKQRPGCYRRQGGGCQGYVYHSRFRSHERAWRRRP